MKGDGIIIFVVCFVMGLILIEVPINYKNTTTNIVGNTTVQQSYADYTQKINDAERRITDLTLEKNHYILSKKESGEPFDEEFARKVYASRINLELKAIDSWKASRDNLPISKEEIKNRFKN